MNKYLFPVLAVLIGFLMVMVLKPGQKGNLKLLLAFSGAFLLSITVFEILPDAFESDNTRTTGLFILLGILLQIVLEFFSKGAEHGHMHAHQNQTFPWAIFISLCLHAFLEGLPLKQGNNLMYGILVHKIPVAFILTTFLLQSGMKSMRIAMYLIVFALLTPLGTFVMNSTNVLVSIESYITAIVIGTFLHISTVILFESSEGHKFNLSKLLAIALAIAIAYFI